MEKKILNIGLIGYGFMGRTHANAYVQASHFFNLSYKPVLKAVCGLSDRVLDFAEQWGFESVEKDWRKLVEREDIDLIDICLPNYLHAEVATAAANAGKMIICEKPLAMDAIQGAAMADAVEKAGVANMVSFNYRRIPAVSLAKKLIDEDKLGRIYHSRHLFLQDWTISRELPQGGNTLWRLDARAAGSGVTGDLLAHNIDIAMWLNGPIEKVCATTETFVRERKHTQTGRMEEVTIDDASLFLARFKNGSLATFEATRYARGHKARFYFEMNGEKASLAWDLHDLHRLQYYDHGDDNTVRGWHSIHVTDGEHPYMDKWWVPGLQIGYEHSFVHQVADFLDGLESGKPAAPTFRDALETQKVCDAVLESGRKGQWIAIN